MIFVVQYCKWNYLYISSTFYVTALKKIQLPPELFEDIQLKGIEIGWPIPAQFLKPCLPCRDALNWVKVDLTYGCYEETDLMKIEESRLPLKQLSVLIHEMTQNLIDMIDRNSMTLEILYVGFRFKDGGTRLTIHWLKFLITRKYSIKLVMVIYLIICSKSMDLELDHPLSFPKLKKLVLNFEIRSSLKLSFIDFTSSAETLESFELNNFGKEYWSAYEVPETICFVNSFAKLRNLKSFTTFQMEDHYEMLDSLNHFENLR